MPYITYKFRIKDSSSAWLKAASRSVNFVWNYCNETSFSAIRKNSEFLSKFDLNNLTSGSSKLLNLHSQTVQAVCERYAKSRTQAKLIKLKWRSEKRSLGWIPFKASSIKITEDSVTYNGNTAKFWKSREIEGTIKSGSFNQDSRRRWYLNIVCEAECLPKSTANAVGIDLGLSTLATLSNGTKYANNKYTKRYANKLAKFQRAGKTKQARNVHAKIANSRKDHNHKVTTEIANNYSDIAVGDLSSKKLIKTKMSKSVHDVAFYQFKTILNSKVIRRQGRYTEVSEYLTTQICSNCLTVGGPKGRKDLSVREWVCGTCQVVHDRDVNAAMNILRLGHQTQFLK